MDWLLWISIGLIALGAIGFGIYKFITNPKAALANIREWLVWAVSDAELKLGGGTGELKLRYVYDQFLQKFPSMAKVISFNTFSVMVDLALDEFKDLLANNESIQKMYQEEVV